MTKGRACWLLLGLLASVPIRAADPVFADKFDDNARQWRLDDLWKFDAGELQVHGVVGQVAVVGQAKPALSDFRATLRCRWMDGVITASYGFLYRFNPQSGNGYFMCCSAAGGYGFGRVQGGEFEIKGRGRNSELMLAGPRTLTIEVKGDLHKLAYNGVDLDTWRDGELTSGGFGLLAIDAAQVAFEELTIDSLAEPGAATPTPPDAGPTPLPEPGTGIGPTMRPGSAFVRLDMVDLDRLRAWRRRYNAMAAAVGDAPLAGDVDATDVAVMAWLRLRQSAAACPPAQWLVDLLMDEKMAAAGAVGPAPQAAAAFALAIAQQPAAGPGETLSGGEDLLGALSWYFAQRGRTAAGWGDKPQVGLAPDAALSARLADDGVQSAKRLDLAQHRPEWELLAAKVKLLAPNLKPKGR
ncbi:MAG: hypothetical protein HZB16_04175 [Armatimonadetes bacterium]|nr:hypothetical protein [Armatimonadota bacterium]